MRQRVLLVDDDDGILDGFVRGLRKAPYEILRTTSPREALRIVAEHAVDLVITDEHMPEMAGTDLLRCVAEDHPAVMRMMLTGGASLDVALKAINEGQVHRFLQKPCNVRELAVAIDQALEVARLRAASMSLLTLAEAQQAALRRAEQDHPGITRFEFTEDGAIVIEEARESLREILREAAAGVGAEVPSRC
jgi:DNA-binding NtrC family response regulator